MRIGFDYKVAIGVGGNATYSRNIIEKICNLDKKNNEYYLFGMAHDFFRSRDILLNKNFGDNCHFVPVYLSNFGFNFIPHKIIDTLNIVIFRFWVNIKKIDLFHFTNPPNFINLKINKIVTIHDLLLLHNDLWAKKKSVIFFQNNIKYILESTQKIISVSKFTRKEIINFFKINPEKIIVIYEAADEIFYFDDDKEYLYKKYGIKDYILCVGQLQERKNLIKLIQAYGILDNNIIRRYNLVLVGDSSNFNYLLKIKETIKNLKLEDKIKILGKVDNHSLRKLYSNAKFFIYPSLFEGFGLPILEAINCNVPVITSNISSLPEVVGESAILVDPESIEEIKMAMEKMFNDYKFYNNLKLKCVMQSKKFSWQKAAEETIRIYNEFNIN
jgi:glycosyltransferase involved in cell wall biosynthesis